MPSSTSYTDSQMPKPLKILHLSSERTWRGGEQQIAYLIEGLSKQHQVENWVAVRKNSAFEKYCKEQGVAHVSLAFSSSLDIKSAWAIKQLCSKQAFDIIHLHTSLAHSIGFLSAVLGNATPMVLTRRAVFKLKSNPLSRWKYNHSGIKKIIAVSGAINEIVKAYVRQPDKCEVVYSGVDIHRFDQKPTTSIRKEFSIDDNELLVGNVAAIAPSKDYYTFVDTIEHLVNRKVEVKAMIIGDGPLENEIKNYVNTKKLENRFVFTGFRTDIKNLLPQLDIFLNTSTEEGLGTSIIDAFCAKVAVVATAAGGIPELVEHEKTGMLAPIQQSQLLADYIIHLQNQPVLKSEMIANAYQKAISDFSKETMSEKNYQVYCGILQNEV